MGFLTALALSGAQAIVEGYCLSLLWGWFMVPTFGLPQLGIAVAIGISCLVAVTTHQYVHREDSEESFMALAMAFANPVLLLLVGFVARLFM